MPSISWRLILRVIAGISWIASIAWFYFEPGWEPFIAVLVGIAALKHSSAVSDAPISIPTSEKTKSAREERNRQGMLELVRNSWVEGVLEQSIHEAVPIKHGLEERRGAVLNQGIELQTPGKPNRLLPPGTKVMDVFDEIGQTLLILGEPGSGKTTLLLKLARDTIARAEKDAKHRIPVVFNLSSWTDTKQPIADWLVGELRTTPYRTPKKIARDWIENNDLLLLLDGLDEVSSEHREACTRAINVFRRERGWAPLVVCCRSEEYEALTTRLDLKGAVSLQPLKKEQVDDYLDQIGQELTTLRAALKGDPILYEPAQTPLMLSIMTLAYRGVSADDLQPLKTIDAHRKHIFDNYVERMFKSRTHRTLPEYQELGSTYYWKQDDKRFSRKDTVHWLSWLAKRMSEHGQTVFLIERMQPDWLPTRAQQRIVTMGAAVMVGLLLGPLFGSVLGLLSGLVFGLLFGLVGYSADIRPVEMLHFSWSKIVPSLRGEELPFGLYVGLLTGLVFGLFFGPLFGLVFGLFFGLAFGITGGKIITSTFPNEGIRRSARSALLIWLLAWLPLGLVFGLLGELSFGLLGGLFSGLVFGLHFGGRACIQHIVLRIMLWRNGSAPLNYARFLDYTAGRIFLRKVGGGYIFVHRLLLEYFASLEPEEEDG
jgi:GTPase SAR1 family protein